MYTSSGWDNSSKLSQLSWMMGKFRLDLDQPDESCELWVET